MTGAADVILMALSSLTAGRRMTGEREIMDGNHGWAWLRWLLALGILASGLGGVASTGVRAQDGGQGELETAALVPADSLLFVSLNTDVSSDQWLIAADLLDQGGLEDIVYGTTAQLVEESGLPAEWITPGSSFLGDEISVALVTGGPNGFDPVVLLSSVNPNQAFETARSRFLAGTDERVTLPVYEEEGLTVLSSYENEMSLARVDDLIVFGTTSGVQQAIGVANGAEPALADQPAFEDLVDELEDDRITTAWANGPALAAVQGPLYGEILGASSATELGLISPVVGLASNAYQAVGVWAEESGFRLDSRMMPGPRSVGLTAPDDATELAERAPNDALLFVDGMDLGQIPILRSYLDSLAFEIGSTDISDGFDSNDAFVYPTIEESYAELDKLIGFDLRADLVDLLEGDYGLWVSSSSLENVDDLTAVFVSDVSDPATVDASIDRLIRLLELEADGELRLNQIRVGGSTVTEILIPDGTSAGSLRVTVGVVDGQLLIGVGAGMEQYLDGPLEESLADAERFEAAFDALPDDEGGRFYLDVHTLIALQDLAALEPTGQIGDPIDDPQLASLEGIQALAAVTRMDDETQVTSVVLTIDADADDDESTRDASPETDTTRVAAGEGIAVTDVTPIEIEEGRIIGMSPADGALLTLSTESDEVCVVSTSGEREACAPHVESVDQLHVAWSPDGRRVAFTQDAARNLVDSDILVFDRDAAEIQNWTDDGYEGRLRLFGEGEPAAPASIAVDITPAWTPDGEAVVFGRTVVSDGFSNATTILYRVDGPGAEAERVAPVALFPFATYYDLGYTEDGRLIYTNGNTDQGDPATGLFELSADGRSVRQILATSEEAGQPFLLGLTSAGSALVAYQKLASEYVGVVPGEPCPLELVDLATTRRTPLVMSDGACARNAGITVDGETVVLFAPSGANLSNGPFLATVNPREVTAAPAPVDLRGALDSTDQLFGNDDSGLTITEDGWLLLNSGPSDGILLQLG